MLYPEARIETILGPDYEKILIPVAMDSCVLENDDPTVVRRVKEYQTDTFLH